MTGTVVGKANSGSLRIWSNVRKGLDQSESSSLGHTFVTHSRLPEFTVRDRKAEDMTLKRRAAVVGASLAVAATILPGTWGHLSTSAVEAAPSIPLAPAPQVFGMRFTLIHVADGRHPVLPNGRRGITRSKAVGVALGFTTGARHHTLLPHAKVVARYGIFSDDELSKRNAAGIIQPLYQNRPAWLVTFSGPGVVESPTGRCCGPSHLGNHNEDNVVIDAATGKWLESYT
jgi:hypothetical protein